MNTPCGTWLSNCRAEQWIPIIIINNYFSMIFLLEVAFIFKVYLFVVGQE